jgi:hypothetical protein
MTQPLFTSVGPIDAANDDAVCETQTPTAGALALDGAAVTDGVAIFDAPRRVAPFGTAKYSQNLFLEFLRARRERQLKALRPSLQ